jgi:hypothetical protein
MHMLYDCISAMPARGDIYWQARPNHGNTVKMSTHTHQQLGKNKTHTHTQNQCFRNCDILVWIWIRGSVPNLWLTDPVLDPAIFVSDIQDGRQQKIITFSRFFYYYFLKKVHLHNFSKIKKSS